MKVELTPDIAQWVEAEVAAGRFPTPEDAVRRAVRELSLNTLRAELEAAEAEGGAFTTEEVRRYVREQSAKRAGYAAMAADEEHEREAREWIEGLIGDADPEPDAL